MAGLVLSAEGGTYLHGLLVYKQLWHRMTSKGPFPREGVRVLPLVVLRAFREICFRYVTFFTGSTYAHVLC